MEKILDLVSQFEKNQKPELETLEDLKKFIDFNIDLDFIELYSNFNGMEGKLNTGEFVLFWNISEIISLNPYFENVQICDELLFFGTDGSSLGYAFDKSNSNIVSIDFYEIMEKTPIIIATSFLDFVKK
jgi:hypothetical protein